MTSTAVPERGRMAELVLYFLRLGFLGFGGPVALVGQMERELVNDKKWLSNGRLAAMGDRGRLLPGDDHPAGRGEISKTAISVIPDDEPIVPQLLVEESADGFRNCLAHLTIIYQLSAVARLRSIVPELAMSHACDSNEDDIAAALDAAEHGFAVARPSDQQWRGHREPPQVQ